MIWDSDTNPYVGYIPADPTSNTPLLKAFLNQGTLFNRDIGLDVRVVAVDYTMNTIRFQWKTSDLKVRSVCGREVGGARVASLQRHALRAS